MPPLASAYLWIKAAHVICVILWIGPQLALALLILPARHLHLLDSRAKAEFVSRANLLANLLMNSAMLGAFLFGGLMASSYWASAGELPAWLWLKIGIVFAVAILHGLLFRQYRQAGRGQTIWHAGRFDIIQGLGLAATSVIVVLAVVKPVMAG